MLFPVILSFTHLANRLGSTRSCRRRSEILCRIQTAENQRSEFSGSCRVLVSLHCDLEASRFEVSREPDRPAKPLIKIPEKPANQNQEKKTHLQFFPGLKLFLLYSIISIKPPPRIKLPPPHHSKYIITTTKLASSIPLPEFLDPYLDHLTPYISPYISSLDDLLTSLQLAISPSTPPKSLPDILPHILVSLGIVSTLAVFMRRFFGRPQGHPEDGYIITDRVIPHIAGDANPDPNRPEDYITIKHGQREFMLKYPTNAVTSGTITVGGVRNECSKLLNLDPDRISLICAGKNLKDNTATLRSLGISHASRILLMGSSTPAPSDPASDSAPKSKKKKKKGGKKAATVPGTPEPETRKVLSPMEKIDAVWDGIGVTLMPLVEEFMNNPPADEVKRADMHRRLSETMMGELLKLDSIESDDPDVRARRKGVVKDIQKILDGLDRVLREQTQVDFDLD